MQLQINLAVTMFANRCSIFVFGDKFFLIDNRTEIFKGVHMIEHLYQTIKFKINKNISYKNKETDVQFCTKIDALVFLNCGLLLCVDCEKIKEKSVVEIGSYY